MWRAGLAALEVGLVVVLAACGLAACTSDTGFNPVVGELAVQPEEVDFAAAVANEEVFSEELHLQNVDAAVLRGDFVVSPEGIFAFEGDGHFDLDPDERGKLVVTFAPAEVEPYDATLTFVPEDSLALQVTVPLRGEGRVPYAPCIAVDPQALDFPSVDQGATASDFFTVTNCGDADLVLGSITQEGAGTFHLQADPSGQTIPPGQTRPYFIEYTALQTNGDSGVLHIPSNDTNWQVVDVMLTANGGGDYDYPVAVIDCPGTVEMIGGPIPVTLDGSGSYDAGYATIDQYAWGITDRPDGADTSAQVDPPNAAVGTLVIDAGGPWEVSLVVINSLGMPSVPAKCEIEAKPKDDLYVELSWSGETSDLDLHLADADAPFYSVPGDVSWCNPIADWGVAGNPDDDGHLDVDVDNGPDGPETAGVNQPADGTYTVRVHAFDDGEDLAVTATVTVFAKGAQIWSESKVLLRNEVWDAGVVNWAQGGTDISFAAGTEPPWDAEGTRECIE